MNAWRVHLTNRAIMQCSLIESGPPALLAVWAHRRQVHYYDVATGAFCGENTCDEAPAAEFHSDTWQRYVDSLVALDGRTHLPLLTTPRVEIRASADGRLRLYHRVPESRLFLELDGRVQRLPLALAPAERLAAVAFDAALGTVAALDDTGRLHLFQQDIAIGTASIGLRPRRDAPLLLALTRGGEQVFASDGQRLISTDSGGRVQHTLETHYSIARLACAPDGALLATADIDSGVIRVYAGPTLLPTHQKIAWDLLANATRLQLFAELPPPETAPGQLLVAGGGRLIFTLGGVLCATHLNAMDDLPQPRPLLLE
ncbi:MAG: hypothetical protein MUE40_08610 [Anaerolineae bacterium]|nr:hypothetical protein [Anaerolineae bacterium]